VSPQPKPGDLFMAFSLQPGRYLGVAAVPTALAHPLTLGAGMEERLEEPLGTPISSSNK